MSAAAILAACGNPVYRGNGIACRGGSWAAGISAAEGGPATAGENHMMSVINGWIGTPYVYGGTTKDGVDCSGFTQAVFRECGVEIPRTASAQAAASSSVSASDLKFGDLVFFNTSGSGISHVGIYVGSGFFVHASSSHGVRRETLAHPYYASRIVCAGRF